MKTIQFIIGITLGSLFAALAAVTMGVLLAHLYWSFRISATVVAVQVALSVLCFVWAFRKGIVRTPN
jgi:uncharacterized membrane protein YqjE